MYKEYKNKNILIIGGAGMIGSTIANILAKNKIKVIIFDSMSSHYGANEFNLSENKDYIKLVKGDICDKISITKIIKDMDIIFNLAAQISYVKSNLNPQKDIDINCKGILNVLEACKDYAQKAKIIFSSSRFVYGKTEYNPVDENHPFNCRSIYGIHKLTGEKYHRYFFDAYGLDTTSVRIANPYGPRQQMKHNEYGIVNWFIRLALEGKPLTVFGDGKQKRDYIFVEDIAKALLDIGKTKNTTGEVYNVGSGMGTSFISMVEHISRLVDGTKIEKVDWPKDRYFIETGDYVSNNEKINNDVNWEPSVDFKTGIKRTIDYYKKYSNHYW